MFPSHRPSTIYIYIYISLEGPLPVQGALAQMYFKNWKIFWPISENSWFAGERSSSQRKSVSASKEISPSRERLSLRRAISPLRRGFTDDNVQNLSAEETNISSEVADTAGMHSGEKTLPETTPALQDQGKDQSTSIDVTDAGVEISEKPEHEVDLEEDVLKVFGPRVEPESVRGPATRPLVGLTF